MLETQHIDTSHSLGHLTVAPHPNKFPSLACPIHDFECYLNAVSFTETVLTGSCEDLT